jgi:hypothetical protein
MEDRNGDTRCSVTSNYSWDDDFTREDFALFDLAGFRGGVNSSHSKTVTGEHPAAGLCTVGRAIGRTTALAALDLPPDSF